MIDALVQHLADSKEELTKQEIQASEDFAVFQSNMEKENEHLAEKIESLIKTIADLTNQSIVANGQLEKRRKLEEEAQNENKEIRQVCDEKNDYYERESKRRNGELVTVDNAKSLFDGILANLSQRVRDRAANVQANEDAGDDLDANVVDSQDDVNAGVSAQTSARAAVVF